MATVFQVRLTSTFFEPLQFYVSSWEGVYAALADFRKNNGTCPPEPILRGWVKATHNAIEGSDILEEGFGIQQVGLHTLAAELTRITIFP